MTRLILLSIVLAFLSVSCLAEEQVNVVDQLDINRPVREASPVKKIEGENKKTKKKNKNRKNKRKAKRKCKRKGREWKNGKCVELNDKQQRKTKKQDCKDKGRKWKNGKCRKKILTKKQCEKRGKKFRNGKCRKMKIKKRNKKNLLVDSRQTSSCSETVSSFTNNFIRIRGPATNYDIQKNRINAYIDTMKKKHDKSGDFIVTSNIVALVGGGDTTNLTCSGGWTV